MVVTAALGGAEVYIHCKAGQSSILRGEKVG